MKLDAHQHFWRYNERDYPWIGAGMEALKRDFLPGDLASEQSAIGFDGSIAVQARQTIAETEWLLELAAAHDRIRAVVGWLDLCSPDLPGQLDRLAPNPRLRGIRHVLQDEPDDQFMLRSDFVAGIAQLNDWRLTYDLLIYPRHLPVARELVSRFPGQLFILDHIGKPPIGSGRLEPWATEIRRIAALPNIACKASGMVTEADWRTWQPADLRPYLDVIFDSFGPDRVMIGSDWPVCTVAASYAQTMDAIIEYIAPFSEQEKELVLGATAMRWYRIEP